MRARKELMPQKKSLNFGIVILNESYGVTKLLKKNTRMTWRKIIELATSYKL